MTDWAIDDGDVRIAPHVEANIDRGPGCWIWRGCRQRDGYGQVTVNYRNWLAHRYVYAALVGPIPTGQELHHTCENRACVNPEHLEAVTRARHLDLTPQFREAQRAAMLARTHCKHGHPWTPENTGRARDDGSRRCRACCRISARRRRGTTSDLTSYRLRAPSQRNTP